MFERVRRPRHDANGSGVAPLRGPRRDADLGVRVREGNRDRHPVQPTVSREYRAIHIHDGRVGTRAEGQHRVERSAARLPHGHFIAHQRAVTRGQGALERRPIGPLRLGKLYRGELELHRAAGRHGLPARRRGAAVPRAGARDRRRGRSGAGRARCEYAEIHARRGPAARIHELEVLGGHPISLRNGLRIESKGVPAGTDVAE